MIYLGLKGDWSFLRKFMCLKSGFRSKRLCHLCNEAATRLLVLLFQPASQEWWHFGESKTCLKNWDPSRTPAPWKPKRALFMQVPGASTPERIKIDLAHTWAIGVGKEFCASSIVAIARLGFFGSGSMPSRLETAWDLFCEWCYAFRETPAVLKDFDYKSLKVTSFLGLSLANTFVPRLQQYPVLCGKGHDCVLVCKWLSYVLAKCAVPSPDSCQHRRNHGSCLAQELQANKDFVQVLRYTADCANAWFRELYKHGVFMPAERGRAILSLAWGVTVTCPSCRAG